MCYLAELILSDSWIFFKVWSCLYQKEIYMVECPVSIFLLIVNSLVAHLSKPSN